MAKKWRVRVSLDDGSSVFLKFQQEPKDNEVFAEANKYIANVQAEQERQIAEANQKASDNAKLALVKDISIATLNTKLGVKSGVTD